MDFILRNYKSRKQNVTDWSKVFLKSCRFPVSLTSKISFWFLSKLKLSPYGMKWARIFRVLLRRSCCHQNDVSAENYALRYVAIRVAIIVLIIPVRLSFRTAVLRLASPTPVVGGWQSLHVQEGWGKRGPVDQHARHVQWRCSVAGHVQWAPTPPPKPFFSQWSLQTVPDSHGPSIVGSLASGL